MAAHGWRLRSTSVVTFIIAGTLAAAHYCSRLHNHCATSPNSGSGHRWGISVTQDSRDSDFYSGCHSNSAPPPPHRSGHISTACFIHIHVCTLAGLSLNGYWATIFVSYDYNHPNIFILLGVFQLHSIPIAAALLCCFELGV